MPRDSKVYLEDILEAIARIQRYTSGLARRVLSPATSGPSMPWFATWK
jgi:uncharacterized protein with HEPN domain